MPPNQIQYSEKYFDDVYEYRYACGDRQPVLSISSDATPRKYQIHHGYKTQRQLAIYSELASQINVCL